jgi:hypothetical protein
LVANLDFIRPQARGSEPIHKKNRPDHHGQQDHGYIGCYLDFIFHHHYLRALSKAELSLNSAALAGMGRGTEWNYFGETAPNQRCRFPIRDRNRVITSAGDKLAELAPHC